ncbi:hypothetical protein EXIGLDRAFT_768843 [Exidia glandulosa HHB12029]|uniref:Uncharacterized protein n=1 Tax=Exidia glandulosa HHB12029 TaxID=1314781 RepID=A0A165HY58_EXIGL|nr:hypothetical protein EXIGLDRAFT_768843 [Exidia glandulosa HHB12029]
MADTQAELLQLYREFHALRREHNALQAERDSLHRDLTQEIESLERDGRQSAAELVQLKEDYAALDKELDRREKDGKNLRIRNQSLEKDVKRLEREAKEARDAASKARRADMLSDPLEALRAGRPRPGPKPGGSSERNFIRIAPLSRPRKHFPMSGLSASQPLPRARSTSPELEPFPLNLSTNSPPKKPHNDAPSAQESVHAALGAASESDSDEDEILTMKPSPTANPSTPSASDKNQDSEMRVDESEEEASTSQSQPKNNEPACARCASLDSTCERQSSDKSGTMACRGCAKGKSACSRVPTPNLRKRRRTDDGAPDEAA